LTCSTITCRRVSYRKLAPASITNFITANAPPPANPIDQHPLVDLAISLKAAQDENRDLADIWPAGPALSAWEIHANVPPEIIIEIYVGAFATACPNVQVMEFPAAWQDHLGKAKAKWGQQLGWAIEWKGASGDWVRYGKAVKETQKGEKYLDVELGRGGNKGAGDAGAARAGGQ
jgi:hypothetical protein